MRGTRTVIVKYQGSLGRWEQENGEIPSYDPDDRLTGQVVQAAALRLLPADAATY